MIAIFVLAFGLAIGSFLSVCAYRIPIARGYDPNLTHEDLLGGESDKAVGSPELQSQEGELENANASLDTDSVGVGQQTAISIMYPARSYCPACEKQLAWYHNIPVFSWLLLGGRCAFCKEKISGQYPLIELLSALFAYLSYSQFGQYGEIYTAVALYIFSCALLVISFIDFNYYMIPDNISYPGTFIGFGVGLLNQYLHIFEAPIVSDLWQSILGVLLGAGVLWFVAWAYLKIRGKDGLGLGDVKLLAMIGAWFGVEGAFYTIFIGSLIGSVAGLLMMALLRRSFKQMLPFGPFLAAAILIFIFYRIEPVHLFM